MDSINPCCALWKTRYSKMEEKRNALRQGVEILKGQIDRLQDENANLKKAYDEERKRTNIVEEEKVQEAALRISMEKEIVALKSEITSAKPEVVSGNEDLNHEITLLRACISEREMEIHQLKELLTDMERRADAEREVAEVMKKSVAELQEALQSEKTRADEACKMADVAGKKAEESSLQLESLKKEVKDSRLKFDELNKKLEAEKQKAGKEKKHADEEKARAIEQRKIAELQRALESEKARADEACEMANVVGKKAEESSLQLESSKKEVKDSRLKCEELNKKLEAEKQKAGKEKKQADEERARAIAQRKIAELQEALKSEKARADEACKMANVVGKKAEESSLQLESSKKEVMDSRLKCEELNEKLEAEKQKAGKEKKQADEEKARAIEQRKIAELQEALESEKTRADEACKMANVVGKKAEESSLQLESLKKEVKDSRLKCEELNKKLEAEKQKAEKKKKCADEEKERAIEQRKIAEANQKKFMDEKCHANSLQMMLEGEKLKVDKLQQEMQELMSSQRSSVLSELEEVKRNLVAEKKKADREKKRADAEMSKKEEQKKVAEANIKKAMEEKSRADELYRNLQCSRQRIEDLEKELLVLKDMLEAEKKNASSEMKHAHAEKLKAEELQRISSQNEKRATKEKCRADNLFKELQHSRQRLQELEIELHTHILRGSPGVPSSGSSAVIINEQTEKVNLLQEQLKFEKERVKHAKDVAEFERDRNSLLQKELHILRQDFKSLLHHLDVLGNTFGSRHGLNNVSKKLGLSNVQNGQLSGKVLDSITRPLYGHGDAELRMSSLSSRDESCDLQENNGTVPTGRCTESPSASFSDEQLVGSQERLAGSLTTSVVLAAENTTLQATTAKQSDECCKRNDGEKVGIVAENNIRSPVEVAACHAEKRRKILDEFESIKFMNSEGKRILQEAEEKISSLQSTIVRPIIEQMEKENLPLTVNEVNVCGDYDQHSKRRKLVSHEPETILLQVGDLNVRTEMGTLKEPSQTAPGRMGNFQSLEDASRDPLKCNKEALISFEQMMNGDYMKLLNLDDDVEEESFKAAMERPVSPGLPEIDYHDIIPISVSKEAGDQHNSALDVACVVFSDMKDSNSISRIFRAIRSCSDLCGLFLQRRWLVQDILAALVLEEDLRPREKVCVLFSLILLNISGILPGKPEDTKNRELGDSFSSHLQSVLLDVDTRSFFVNICDLSEFLNLAEDFVFNRRILLESDEASASVNNFGSNFEILLEGEKVILCPNMASSNMVMGGCIVLASICKTVDRIDSVCEVSFNLLHACGADKSMVLMILHMFAHLCGEEYFTASDFHLVMEVIKSIVTFFEGIVVDDGDMLPQSGNDSYLRFPACDLCPFSKGSVSLDDVLSLLLKELQDNCCQHPRHHDIADLAHSMTTESLPCFLDDVLSSLELIASMMGFGWACDKIVPKLAKILESCDQERAFTALVSFLGQLGRHGAEAVGYDNAGVETIRVHLLEILCRTVTLKHDTSPPVTDMTVVCALLGLYPHICEELVKGNAEFLFIDEPSSSAVLKECLSSLSSEQISFLFGGRDNPVIAAQ